MVMEANVEDIKLLALGWRLRKHDNVVTTLVATCGTSLPGTPGSVRRHDKFGNVVYLR